MKRFMLSVLVGILVFGAVYFGKTVGLEVGAAIATGLTPPREPLDGYMLLIIDILPYFMGIFAGVFLYVMLGEKQEEKEVG